MFTGIVSAVAKVVDIRGAARAPVRIGIDHAWIAKHLKVGGSVAVNGACLTVVKKQGPVFFADVVAETRKRTNLGALQVGDEVNLELPVTAAQTFDGHIVQGHVDATAEIVSVDGNEVTFELPATLSRLVAYKGSIAVDGVSLTVAAVDKPPGTFKVALIPHTLEATVAKGYKPGTTVNLEADVIARYVARNLRG
jgi:riboflavin synthase alpha subunit